jgi:hypothetical protein
MAQVTPHAAFARRSPSGRKLTSHDFSEARRPHASHMPGLPIDIRRPERATGSAGYGVDIDRPRSAIDADSDHVGPASSRRRGLPIGAYQAKGLPATAGGARRRRPGPGIRARGRVTGTPSPSATASGSPDRLPCLDPVRHMSVISGSAEHTIACCGGLRRRLECGADAGPVGSSCCSARYK